MNSGIGDGQGGLACCDSWGHKEWDTIERLNQTELKAHPKGFPGGSDGKESACNSGEQGSIPESGRYLGEGNVNLLQYSCVENSMDRGAWWVTVYRVTKSRT